MHFVLVQLLNVVYINEAVRTLKTYEFIQRTYIGKLHTIAVGLSATPAILPDYNRSYEKNLTRTGIRRLQVRTVYGCAYEHSLCYVRTSIIQVKLRACYERRMDNQINRRFW